MPDANSGDTIAVSFEVISEGGKLELEIFRRESEPSAPSRFHRIASYPAARNMTVRHQIREDGSYVVVVRQPRRAASPIEARFAAAIIPARQLPSPAAVRTLSSERRLAVVIFSVGLLWTTLVVCGTPIIRAFRSRKKREVPPWFG